MMDSDSSSNPVSRRSFLGRVVGGVAATGGAMTMVAGTAHAQANYTGVTDCDRGEGGIRDRPGYGRGQRNQYTDSDSGPNRDPPCGGRGTSSGSPTGTQYNSNQPHTGCSDSDYGSNGDPSGYGRACRGRDPNAYAPHVSGCSDRDPGDSIGNGRSCTPPR